MIQKLRLESSYACGSNLWRSLLLPLCDLLSAQGRVVLNIIRVNISCVHILYICSNPRTALSAQL